MSEIIAAAEERMKKTLVSLKDGFSTLRTGRASAALFDKIRVDAYGEKSPLNQVANISVPEARLIVIQPWDRALIGEIEKAIRSSELSLNPSNDELKKLLKDSKITEDQESKSVEEFQKLTDSYIGKINQTLEEKEKEIMEV
jgi:ribosome recycling factor